jgi:hypothetical protein
MILRFQILEPLVSRLQLGWPRPALASADILQELCDLLGNTCNVLGNLGNAAIL